MSRRQIYYIIEWSVAVAACVWLVWKLATYEDYPALWATLQGMGWKQYVALALCVALMPLNMGIEAWRWRTLMNGDAPLNGANELTNERMNELTFKEAQRQVYYSKLAGLITPWRLGEYPARGVLMSEGVNELTNEGIWPKVLSMGAVGSATMTFAIVATGLVALSLEIGYWRLKIGQWTVDNGQYLFFVGAVILLLIVALVMAPRLLRRFAEVSHRLIIKSVGQSLVRLGCWCVQLALVLYALGAVTGYGLQVTGLRCLVYYLLVTVTPNVPIAEVGVRGFWAMQVFGTMNAALAGVLLWVINTLLPCLVWFLFYVKKNTENN